MRSAWLPLALLGSLCAGAAGVAAAQAIYTPPPGQNFQGVWLIQGDHSAIRTVAGKLPPMTRSAAARYAPP